MTAKHNPPWHDQEIQNAIFNMARCQARAIEALQRDNPAEAARHLYHSLMHAAQAWLEAHGTSEKSRTSHSNKTFDWLNACTTPWPAWPGRRPSTIKRSIDLRQNFLCFQTQEKPAILQRRREWAAD